jgi:hypothetical protein
MHAYMQHYMQHGHAALHAAWTCNADMQHGQAAFTSSLDMQQGHAAFLARKFFVSPQILVST